MPAFIKNLILFLLAGILLSACIPGIGDSTDTPEEIFSVTPVSASLPELGNNPISEGEIAAIESSFESVISPWNEIGFEDEAGQGYTIKGSVGYPNFSNGLAIYLEQRDTSDPNKNYPELTFGSVQIDSEAGELQKLIFFV